MAANYYFLYVQIFLALIGVLAPLLQPKNLLFGVRLSKGLLKQKEVSKFKKSFIKLGIQFFTTWIVVCNIVTFKNYIQNNYIIWGEIVILFSLYIFFNNRVKKWKSKMLLEDPDLKPKNPTKIVDTTFHKEKLTISSIWITIPASFLIFQIFINISNKKLLTDNSELLKSITKLLTTNLALLAVIFWKNFMIKNVKQQINASNPEVSKAQNIIFRRRWSMFLFILFTIIIGLNVIYNLQSLNIITSMDFFFQQLYSITIGIIIIGTLLMSFLIGQSGNRLKIKKGKPETYFDDVDDDSLWKAGIFYYNPNDPSLWIDKRMGIGWTLNFGNKKAWIYVVVILGLIIISLLKN